MFPRLFGNGGGENRPFGTVEENGVGKFNYVTDKALSALKEFGVTHVWYTGVLEHATMTDYSAYGIAKDFPQLIKGRAGSPYAVKDYYDVDPDLAVDVNNRMNEFESLIERTHNNDMKVIMDFIPNHLARFYSSDSTPKGEKVFGERDDLSCAFNPKNNFYYLPDKELMLPGDIYNRFAALLVNSEPFIERPAKATGNDVFSHRPSINDWYETVKLNYGVDPNTKEGHFKPIPDTWERMKQVILYWRRKGIDAFRCDMAEMVPLEFWKWMISEVRKDFPKLVFIAEIYNPSLYNGFVKEAGFDYLYDKVGLYDILKDVMSGHKSALHISSSWQSLDGLDDHMLRFMENHDEQRIASDFFAGSAVRGIPAMMVSAYMNNGPLMIYQGQETGERGMDQEGFSGRDGRTTIFDYWCLEEFQRWVNGGKFDGGRLTPEQKALYATYKKINQISQEYTCFSEGKLYDLMWVNQDKNLIDPDKIYAFLRHNDEEIMLVVVSFLDNDCEIKLKIPHHAFEMLGISDTAKIHGKEIFHNTQEFTLAVGEVFSEGARMSLKANSGLVWEIEQIEPTARF
jgi:glycosidase